MPTRFLSLPRALLTAAAAAVLALAGCGGEDDPAALLQRAFDTPIESANATITARASLRGSSPQFQQPIDLRISGPYRRNEDNQLPSLDWEVSASQGPGGLTGRLVTVPDNVFVVFQSAAYELGRPRVQQALQDAQRRRQGSLTRLGVKPATWIVDPRMRGEAEVAEEDTTRVSGRLDLARMLRDVNRAQNEQARQGLSPGPGQEISEPQIAEIVRAVQQPTMDVFVAGDDTVRRLMVNAPFTVPPRQRQSGVEGGTVKVTTEFSDVGGDQEVTAPPNPRPLEELLTQFGLPSQGALPPGAPRGR